MLSYKILKTDGLLYPKYGVDLHVTVRSVEEYSEDLHAIVPRAQMQRETNLNAESPLPSTAIMSQMHLMIQIIGL
jgi:hypothetical protein